MLIQEAITNFIELFPTASDYGVDRDEYNRIMNLEFERVRDFLLLHYVATTRSDSPNLNVSEISYFYIMLQRRVTTVRFGNI